MKVSYTVQLEEMNRIIQEMSGILMQKLISGEISREEQGRRLQNMLAIKMTLEEVRKIGIDK